MVGTCVDDTCRVETVAADQNRAIQDVEKDNSPRLDTGRFDTTGLGHGEITRREVESLTRNDMRLENVILNNNSTSSQQVNHTEMQTSKEHNIGELNIQKTNLTNEYGSTRYEMTLPAGCHIKYNGVEYAENINYVYLHQGYQMNFEIVDRDGNALEFSNGDALRVRQGFKAKNSQIFLTNLDKQNQQLAQINEESKSWTVNLHVVDNEEVKILNSNAKYESNQNGNNLAIKSKEKIYCSFERENGAVDIAVCNNGNIEYITSYNKNDYDKMHDALTKLRGEGVSKEVVGKISEDINQYLDNRAKEHQTPVSENSTEGEHIENNGPAENTEPVKTKKEVGGIGNYEITSKISNGVKQNEVSFDLNGKTFQIEGYADYISTEGGRLSFSSNEKMKLILNDGRFLSRYEYEPDTGELKLKNRMPLETFNKPKINHDDIELVFSDEGQDTNLENPGESTHEEETPPTNENKEENGATTSEEPSTGNEEKVDETTNNEETTTTGENKEDEEDGATPPEEPSTGNEEKVDETTSNEETTTTGENKEEGGDGATSPEKPSTGNEEKVDESKNETRLDRWNRLIDTWRNGNTSPEETSTENKAEFGQQLFDLQDAWNTANDMIFNKTNIPRPSYVVLNEVKKTEEGIKKLVESQGLNGKRIANMLNEANKIPEEGSAIDRGKLTSGLETLGFNMLLSNKRGRDEMISCGIVDVLNKVENNLGVENETLKKLKQFYSPNLNDQIDEQCKIRWDYLTEISKRIEQSLPEEDKTKVNEIIKNKELTFEEKARELIKLKL